jgi:hypothetical protein
MIDLKKIKQKNRAPVVRHIILDTWEAEIRRIVVSGQARQKVHETPISTNSWEQWCAPVMPVIAESINRRNTI